MMSATEHGDDRPRPRRDRGALGAGVRGHDDPAARELQELALALRPTRPSPIPSSRFSLAGRGRLPARGRLAGAAAASPARAPAAGHVPRALPAGVSRPSCAARRRGVAGGLAGRRRGRVKGGGPTRRAAEAGGGWRPRVRPDAAAQAVPGGAGRGIAPAPPSGGFAPGRATARSSARSALELEAPVDELARVADHVTERDRTPRRLRAQLLVLDRRGGRGRRLRAAHPVERPSARAARSLGARHRPLAEPVGPRRDP